MPSPADYLARKISAPSELRSAEWDTVSVWLRERAFFMASVARAETLQAFRNAIAAVTAGGMGAAEARQRMREFLASSGYQALPGLEGTIKDLASTQRLKVSIDTNVDMAHGWARREENLGDVMHPAQELYRAGFARQPRNWEDRWDEAANAVGWEGVAQNGQMIALTTSPIWVALSRFGLPYPPFDYGSHMSVRLVSLEKCIDIGLVDDPQALRAQMESARSSFNEGVEKDVSSWSKDILAEIEKQLQGLAVLDHGVLRMTDPNGTTPYSSEYLASILSLPLPNGIPHLQLQALRDWMEDSRRFNPLTEEELKSLQKRDEEVGKEDAKQEKRPKVSLNEKEDFARLIHRIESKESDQTLHRGMGFGGMEKYNSFLREITSKGYYQAKEGRVADSWTLSDRTAESYASAKRWQVKLFCTHHKSAKDLRPLYNVAQPQYKTPGSPLATEAEYLIPGNIRMRILRYKEEDIGGGKRLTLYCEEE